MLQRELYFYTATIYNYIHLNPMRGKWSLVNDPTEYYHSSCRFYEKGINDFEFLKDYRDRTE